MELDYRHDEAQGLFWIPLGEGERAVLRYARLDAETLDYRSTVVPVAHRNEGIGARLVLHALDWARDAGYRVRPSCPFVSTVVDDHPGYRDVLV